MVKSYFNKIKLCLKRTFILAITFSVITNLILGDIAFAKKFEISDKDIERIKSAIDWMKTFWNIGISDDKLKTILNLTTKAGETGIDITYGALILTSLSEMEFVDMVASQRYKTMATEYFDSILDERLNLGKYYQGVGWDALRVLTGRMSNPIAALTLNTFEITNNTIQIGLEIYNLKLIKLYDGLWYYFDTRGAGGESHQTTWEEAKIVMGWATSPSFPFEAFGKIKTDNESQLESQFATLWDKWGPYITPSGLSEKAKKQVKEELTNTLTIAIKQTKFAEEETKPSLTEKLKLVWESLVREIEKIKNLIGSVTQNVKNTAIETLNKLKSTFSKLNPFEPAAIVQTPISEIKEQLEQIPAEPSELKPEEKTAPAEVKQSKENLGTGGPLTLEEIQEMLDDIAERIDAISAELAKLAKEKKIKIAETEEEPEEIEEEELEEKETDICFVNINTASKEELQKITGVGPVIAQKIIDARPFSSIYDLIKVSGIGEITLQKIINQGCAYVDSTVAGTGSGAAPTSTPTPSPQIILNYPKENPVNKEIEVTLSTSNLKNATYDVKISIESGTTTLSDIYNETKNEWQSSYKYATSTFSGTSFSGNFKLRIKEDKKDFRGEAEIIAKIRDNQTQKIQAQWQGKINITEPELEPQPQRLAENIVISEVQIAGKEFVELYNSSDEDINLCENEDNCWYLSYFSANRDWNDPWRINLPFSTSTIIASSSYYLIALKDYSTSTDGYPEPDWQPSVSTNLSNESGAIGIFSCDPSQLATTTEAQVCKIDVVGWRKSQTSDEPIVKEATSTIAAPDGKSLNRKRIAGKYIDNDNNFLDFEIKDPTPTNSKGESGNILPPEKITDLSVTQIDDFTIQLAWLVPSDPDTPQANLSYEIRYLRNVTIADENWASSTQIKNPPPVAEASTTQEIIISDLNYQTFYSFAIRTFDGKNYSPISNVVFLITSIPQNSSPWPMYQHDGWHTGQSQFSILNPIPTSTQIFSLDGGSLHSPAIDVDGTIYLNTSEGLYALNPTTRIIKWHYQTNVGAPTVPAIGSDGSIYFISNQKLINLNRDGTLKWEFIIDSYYPDIHPLIDNEKIYILVGYLSQGQIYPCLKAIDLDNGNLFWSFELSEEEKAEVATSGCNFFTNISSPAIDSAGIIYFGFAKTIFAIDSSGNEKWKVSFNQCGISPPIISNGKIYIGVDRVYALDWENGTKFWFSTSSLSGFTYLSPAIGLDGTLYFVGSRLEWPGLANYYFEALDSDGNLKWEIPISGWNSAPIVDNQRTIYLVDGSWLKALNPIDGSLKWKIEIYPNYLSGTRSLALGENDIIYISAGNILYTIK